MKIKTICLLFCLSCFSYASEQSFASFISKAARIVGAIDYDAGENYNVETLDIQKEIAWQEKAYSGLDLESIDICSNFELNMMLFARMIPEHAVSTISELTSYLNPRMLKAILLTQVTYADDSSYYIWTFYSRDGQIGFISLEV